MASRAFGQDKFLTVNGLHGHYVEWGTPGQPAMVLLHGFQSNAHTWDTFSYAMATDYHVLALDQRGHGDTSWAPEGAYGPEAFVSDIVGFIQSLNLRPTVLIGHSMGGRHAAMVAADYPDLIAKIVIVDTAAELPPARQTRLNQAQDVDKALEPETFENFEAVIANALGQYPLTPEAELRHANYHNLYRSADGKWRWRWDLALLERRRQNRRGQPDMYTYLQRVQCPALLVRGVNSPLLTSEVAEKMCQTLPKGRLAEINQAAHTVNADNAEAFHAAVTAFLQA
jgi:pimeloyl-ACP methyl ester carboxylesterase